MNPPRRDLDARLDYSKLSSEDLETALQALLAGPAPDNEKVDWIQRVMHELQVHRCELEMQNRSLRDAQEDLEEAVHRYADLYDSLPIGYVTLTPTGQIVEANQSAADLLHLPREQLPGRFLRAFVAEPDTAAFAAHLAACLEDRARHSLELLLEPPDRAAVAVQLSSRRARSRQEDVLIRTALTDISSLKETQAVLRDVIAEQESFLYSVSHDLRAPLVTITQFSALLNDGSISGGEPTRDVIDRIRRAALRMDALLQTLLEYSRVSRAEAVAEVIDCGDVVTEVLQQHHGVISQRQARVEVQPNLPHVCGSRCLLSQVISNLVTNALKYSQPDRVPVVRITATEQERTVTLCVADEGIGIAPHHHERIFRMFERLHGPSTYPGSGIGLALVRRAVDKMRGRVWVESDVGQGSRFFVELPRFC